MDETTSAMDRATAQAWREFQAGLADRLAELGVDEILIVEALAGTEPDDGAAPYVQFCAWGEDMLRGEVAGNHVLAPAYELDAAGESALRELGYDAPTYAPDEAADGGSLNFHIDIAQEQADRLAVMSVRALREVLGVPHPALLSGDLVADAPPEPGAAERAQVDEEAAAFPYGGQEELTELVDAALTPYFGHPPRHDDDGDIPVDLGSTVLFVRVCETVPVIELFACVATDVQDAARAAFEINVLNRDVRYVKFRLVGDSILADLHLPAWPFAPEQLRATLAVMTGAIEQVAEDLQARVGGRALLADAEVDVEDHPGEESDGSDGPGGLDLEDPQAPEGPADQRDASDRLGPRRRALATEVLTQLEAETTGSVTPELAASVCGHGVELILTLIGEQERLAASWGALRDDLVADGATGDDVGCDHEIDHAERMVTLLRRALRVTVERQAAREEPPAAPAAPGASSARRRAQRGPTRPRRVPDPTIEEVDPDIWG